MVYLEDEEVINRRVEKGYREQKQLMKGFLHHQAG
jgi:hypothetical protein